MTTPPERATRRRGSVLLLVLVVVAILALGTATYLDLMQHELQAVRHHGRQAQAAMLAESGVEYVRALLALTPAELQSAGGLVASEASFRAVIVDDAEENVDRGRFTVLAPAQIDGLYSGIRFGLENESAKLNLNTLLAAGAEDQAVNRLLGLPGMTQEIAEAIVDWLDPDETARLAGAEAEYYSLLDPPYEPRNGPIAAIDELLLVRGVTPELLYGLDQNRNYFADLQERPRGLLAELDNSDGSLNRGWSAYLTVSSVENLTPPPDSTLVDLNGQDLQKLYNDLKSAVGDDQAKFAVLYRQYGAQPAAQPGAPGQGGASGPGGGQPPGQGGGPADGGPQTSPGPAGPPGPGTPGAPGGGSPTPVSVAVSAVQLKFDQQGGQRINSPLDLVGVTVQIPGENNNPPQNVASPWTEDAASYRKLLDLYDAALVTSAQRVAGRINLHAASRPVLRSIPGLTEAAIGQIIARREAEPDRLLSDQRHAVWLLIENIVTLAEMRPLERYVTTGGDVFSGQAVGFFDAGPAAARGEFLVERLGAAPQMRGWHDLSNLGRGYSSELLGVEIEQPPAEASVSAR